MLQRGGVFEDLDGGALEPFDMPIGGRYDNAQLYPFLFDPLTGRRIHKGRVQLETNMRELTAAQRAAELVDDDEDLADALEYQQSLGQSSADSAVARAHTQRARQNRVGDAEYMNHWERLQGTLTDDDPKFYDSVAGEHDARDNLVRETNELRRTRQLLDEWPIAQEQMRREKELREAAEKADRMREARLKRFRPSEDNADAASKRLKGEGQRNQEPF